MTGLGASVIDRVVVLRELMMVELAFLVVEKRPTEEASLL